MSDTGSMVSEQQIERARTEAGGWTRDQLAAWGVPWPPPKGWRARLIEQHEQHEHKPRRHRDDRPPWCDVCGLE